MSDVRVGPFCKFYVNEGTHGTPEWTEIDLISDLADNAAWEEGDSSVRRSRVRTMEPTMLTLDLTGRIRTDYDDDGYKLIRDAFIGNITLDAMMLTGPVTKNGSLGFRFDAKVFGFGEDQALSNVIFNDFTIKPCASDNDPSAVVVTDGEPVFSPIGASEDS